MDQLYARTPRTLQHLAVSTRGLYLRRERLGSSFRRILAGYEARNRSSVQTEEDRHRFLREALGRAVEAPAYRSLDLSDPEDIQAFPLTTKQDHALGGDGYRLDHRGRLVRVATGGSTGTPLRFVTTREAIRHQWAVWWRYRRWHGIELDTWCGYFGGKPTCPPQEDGVFWRYNAPGRQVMFSTPHLTAETVEQYVEEINRRRLRWLHGLPSTISLLTTYMEAADLRFGSSLQWISFGSENVPAGAIADIQRVHGIRALDHYGLGEAVANLSQCRHGRLHVDEDFSYVEFLPYESGPSDDDALYRLVGTAFTNPAQAFVRYDTGDLVSGVEDGCDCGRPGRTVARVDGRTASYARLPSGARIGPISHIFRGIEGIAQGQVFVTSQGVLVFHIVPGAGYEPSVAAEIEHRVRGRAVEPVEVVVVPRSGLVRGPNGKVPVVVQGEPPTDEPSAASVGR